jgi:membrane protein implicated in regulation of membrane protease activity
MTLPWYIRRGHRIFAMLWLLSLVVTLVVPAASEEVPGSSLVALFFIATVATGSYLLVRPWIRRTGTISGRLKRLKQWDMPLPAIVRRIHRLVATLWLGLLALALSLEAAGGPGSQLVILTVVVFLLFLVLTGGYMFLRPWVNRIRAR